MKADERLAELYLQHGAQATRLAYLLTGDTHAAEDAAQEAFIRLGSRLLLLRYPSRAAGYLYRTVTNLARDHGRRVRKEGAGQAATHASSTQVPDVETRDEVLTGMMQIAPRHRLVLFLRYYLDMSESQAADVLACSTSAVKSLTNRAKASLRQQLQGEER